MITNLRIKGYKCLKDVELELKPFTVLWGPNDSGKSSVIDALHALGQSSRKPVTQVFGGTHAIEQISWRGSDKPGLQLEVTIEDSGTKHKITYQLQVGIDPRGLILINETITRGDQRFLLRTEEGSYEIEGHKYPLPGDNRTQTLLSALRNETRFPPVNQIANMLFPIEKYKFDPKKLMKDSLIQPDVQNPRMRSDGGGLPSVLAHLLGTDRERFDELEAELKKNVPILRHIVLRRIAVESRKDTEKAQPPSQLGDSLSFKITDRGWEIPASLASDGVLLFLGYLALVYSEAPKVIVNEEPENGVHPHRLKKIVEALRTVIGDEKNPRTQVLISTHSPYLIDFVKPEEVIIFNKDEEGATQCMPLKDVTDVDERLKERLEFLGEFLFNLGEDGLRNLFKARAK